MYIYIYIYIYIYSYSYIYIYIYICMSVPRAADRCLYRFKQHKDAPLDDLLEWGVGGGGSRTRRE